ncbi:MAG: DUF4333 domain-containing protein [Kofleriaceae bacterium]|nr:DUF4333 domain-containing protein [Myxococcales bacterium]MCB9561789.1 DUF4333 domain-containing protein [Kofleriaceae bacterium]MCB9575304.1 DUF4333 domain-containing protein [Kofleriaceae bacterium]
MRTLAIGIAIAGATLGLAACEKKIDKSDAEKKIKSWAEDAIGPVKSVSCPAAKRKKGVTFECTVAFKDGGDYKVAIDQKDDEGNVEWKWIVQPIGTDAMEKMMIDDFKAKGHEGVTVECGSGIITLPAEGVTCKVSAQGETVDFQFKIDGKNLVWAPKDGTGPGEGAGGGAPEADGSGGGGGDAPTTNE